MESTATSSHTFEIAEVFKDFFQRRGWVVGTVLLYPGTNRGMEPQAILLGRDPSGVPALFLLWRIETKDKRDLQYIAHQTQNFNPSQVLEANGTETVNSLVAMRYWTDTIRDIVETLGLIPVTPFDLEFNLLDRCWNLGRAGDSR